MIITILFTIVTPITLYINVIQPMLDAREQAKEDAIYDSKLFDVEVTDKSNITNQLGYNVSNFTFKITNHSTQDIVALYGVMTVKDADNGQLFTGNVELTGFLKSGDSSTWNVQVERSENLSLWDTEYDFMNIYFRITEIDFNQGGFKRYDNQDVLIKSPKSSSSGNLPGDGANTPGESSHIITFDSAGGNLIDNLSVVYNCEFVLPTPVRDGYDFAGWYYNSDRIESGTYNFTSSINLTARWNAIFKVQNSGSTCAITGLTDYGKQNYTEIIIPNQIDGFNVTAIGDDAFENRSSLTSITIPDSVTSIGNGAFDRCTGLTEIIIPSSVNAVGDGAFCNCTGLTEITIPNSVTSIGNSAFSGCTGLTSIIIPDGVTSIGNYAFSRCSGLTSVVIPDSVTSIREWAFAHCTGLINIVIPDSVTSIGHAAFYECTGLTSIVIPDSIISIEEWAFAGCTGLSSMNYLGTLDEWVQISFGDSTSNPICHTNKLIINSEEVTNAIISNGVTSIGKYAFADYTGLTSVVIPDSVTSIGHAAFYECTGLTSIVIPDSVTSIREWAFYRCTGLTSIVISDSVTSIGDCVFFGCTGFTSIVIPDSVTSIGDSAFSDCTRLTSVVIPDSVTSIGNYAFSGCTGLTSIKVDLSNPVYTSRDESGNEINGIIEIASMELISGCNNTIIPDGVTSIGEWAFGYCTGLTSIIIPDSVTSIGEQAFHGCMGLTSIVIPDSVISIGNYAFAYTGLTSIVISDSVTSIGVQAFSNCIGLTSVVIPDSVTSIRFAAFYGCTGLTTIYCEASSQPSGWDLEWSFGCSATVIWGYKG